jgi:transposase-like protein
MSEIQNLSQLAKHFSDEAEAWKLVERLRWSNGPVCPHCGAVNKAYYLEPTQGTRKTRTGKVTYRRVWKCAECREQFSVLVGTIFEDSHIPLSKWLLAIHMLCAGKNGVSALELSRTLNLAYRSAWFMAHRIRYAMERPPLVDKLQGVVESDETYIGGKPRQKAKTRSESAKRRLDNKTPVHTLVERGGEARSRALKRVTGETLGKTLQENVAPSATLMTDELKAYQALGRQFAKHETVNHREGEYARHGVHVNTAEGYFSQLKRSIDGTHHHVSERHLPRYLAEFDYRYNTRKIKDGERTERAIRQTVGKRLRYQEPVDESPTTG